MQSTEQQLCERYREVRMRLRAPPMKAVVVAEPSPPLSLPMPAPLSGDLDYCHCGSMGDEGHTLSCVLEQRNRRPAQVPLPIPDDEGPIIKRLTLARILNTVSVYYGVKVIHAVSARRTKDVMLPRHVAMYLAREHTLLSFPHIGRLMGGRDHSTILVACRKIARLLSEGDEQLASDLRALRQELGV